MGGGGEQCGYQCRWRMGAGGRSGEGEDGPAGMSMSAAVVRAVGRLKMDVELWVDQGATKGKIMAQKGGKWCGRGDRG